MLLARRASNLLRFQAFQGHFALIGKDDFFHVYGKPFVSGVMVSFNSVIFSDVLQLFQAVFQAVQQNLHIFGVLSPQS